MTSKVFKRKINSAHFNVSSHHTGLNFSFIAAEVEMPLARQHLSSTHPLHTSIVAWLFYWFRLWPRLLINFVIVKLP